MYCMYCKIMNTQYCPLNPVAPHFRFERDSIRVFKPVAVDLNRNLEYEKLVGYLSFPPFF